MEYKSCQYFILFASLLLSQKVIAPPVTNSLSQFGLENFVEPEEYLLSINVSRRDTIPFIYGQVIIKILCQWRTDKIILNAKNMIIPQNQVGVSLITEPGQLNRLTVITSDFHENNPESGLFVIDMGEVLEQSKKYEVFIPFTCNTQSAYFEEQFFYDFERNWIKQEIIQVMSKLSPGGASQLFPCFEESNRKAKFKISIEHDKDVTALSNWPLKPNDNNLKTEVYTGLLENQVRDEFEETEPILPSGVSFAVVDLKSTELNNSEAKVLIRFWEEEKSLKDLDIAKEVAMKVMLFYLDYFKVPLDSTKLDIVALPKIDESDTDKLGLISVKESSLLYLHEDDQKYFDITRDMCFAINRQWIDTLVTLSNPKETHFHRALSYFLEEICINKVNPHSAFNFIGLRNVITFSNVLKPYWEKPLYSEVESVFTHKLPDRQTQKALHLFRMLFSVVKEGVFQNTLEAYVKKFKHSFSTLNDLWDIFPTDASEPVSLRKYMNFYANRIRFPLIRMDVNPSTQTVTISQETFRFLGEKKNQVKDYCWPIPLSFKSTSGRKFEDPSIPKWLTCDKTESFNVDLDLGEWILVNSSLNVLGHTYLDDENWKLIQKTFLRDNTFENLDESTRANILLDMFALAETGEVPYERVFDTMNYLTHETSAICWIIALTEFNKIYSYLLGEKEVLELFQNYVRGILEILFGRKSNIGTRPAKYKKSVELTSTEKVLQDYNLSTNLFHQPLNLESELKDGETKEPSGSLVHIDDLPQNDRLKKEMKKLFNKTACKFDVGDCEDQCVILYENWKKSLENKEHPVKEIPAEIQDFVLCHAIKWLPKSDWDSIWELYDKTKTSKENDVILKALGCSTKKDILNEYLSITMDNIYPGDHLKAFASLSSSENGYSSMKKFLRNNIHDLDALIKNNWNDQPIKLQMYFAELFSITTKETDMTELLALMKRPDVALILDLNNPSELLRKSLERGNRNIAWLEKHKSTFSKLLGSYKKVNEET